MTNYHLSNQRNKRLLRTGDPNMQCDNDVIPVGTLEKIGSFHVAFLFVCSCACRTANISNWMTYFENGDWGRIEFAVLLKFWLGMNMKRVIFHTFPPISIACVKGVRT